MVASTLDNTSVMGPGKVCFAFANGCPRSKASMSTLVEYFKVNGWEVTTNLKDAGLIVFGCCGFDSFNEEASFKYLSIVMKKKMPETRVVVFGCLSGINEVRLLKEFDVIPVPPKSTGNMDALIGARVKFGETREPHDLAGYMQQFRKCFNPLDHARVKAGLSGMFKNKVLDRLTFNSGTRPLSERVKNVYEIKVAKGCLGNCSYCAIKFAVGTLRSKDIDHIMSEFDEGIAAGYKNIRLLADDVGAYGQDKGSSIAELLDTIFSNTSDFKLMWDDFSPNWLVKYNYRLSGTLAANSSRIGYIGFPVQSGSERIIKLMQRDYTVSDAVGCLKALKESSPGMHVTTHALVGFPGEEEEDFTATVDMLDKVGFSDVQAYSYCDRPRTLSIDLPGKVADKVKVRRLREIHKRFRTSLP